MCAGCVVVCVCVVCDWWVADVSLVSLQFLFGFWLLCAVFVVAWWLLGGC